MVKIPLFAPKSGFKASLWLSCTCIFHVAEWSHRLNSGVWVSSVAFLTVCAAPGKHEGLTIIQPRLLSAEASQCASRVHMDILWWRHFENHHMNVQMFPCDLLVLLSNCMNCFKNYKSASSGAFPGFFFSRTDMVEWAGIRRGGWN